MVIDVKSACHLLVKVKVIDVAACHLLVKVTDAYVVIDVAVCHPLTKHCLVVDVAACHQSVAAFVSILCGSVDDPNPSVFVCESACVGGRHRRDG